MKKFNVAVVGATGMVGNNFWKFLLKDNFLWKTTIFLHQAKVQVKLSTLWANLTL